MSKRFNNKRLLFILAGLVLALILTLIFRTPGQRSTITSDLFDIDTSAVQKIVFFPKKATGEPFEFVKYNQKWIINQGNVTAKPEKNAIQNILSGIMKIRPQSLVAVDKSAFQEYELTDSLAARVKLLSKNEKVLADVMIGKFTYRQIGNPYQYGGNNISGTTYIRIYDENKIYAVDGFLALSFSGEFNDWRDKSFLECNKDDITKISFKYPADSSYVLELKDSVWFAGNQPADSLNISNYLNTLSHIYGENFADDFNPGSVPDYQLIIEGNNLLSLLVICYSGQGHDEYGINSDMNPEVYFKSSKNGLFGDLFKPESFFMNTEKKK